MHGNGTERHGEGVRLLRAWKEANGKTVDQMTVLLGYQSTDSYFRICRYEYRPSPDVCERIAKMVGKSRAWVLDHWATGVARRKEHLRRTA